MAPIKYEEQMKDKLEKRSLQPSPDSWSKLSNRLDAEQKNKSKSLYWWIGIAASVIGVLLVTTVFFNKEPITNDTQIIVNRNDNKNQEESKVNEKSLSGIQEKSEEVAADVNTELLNDSSNMKTSNPNVKKNTKENEIIKKSPQQNVVAESYNKAQEAIVSSDIPNDEVDQPNQQITTKPTFEEQKVQDVIAQIKALNADGLEVTDAEIDSLLKNAQREILSNRLYNETTRTVDANALLQDVEQDLQQSFRSKVFEALQSGYESVKTAVAERNN